MRGTVIMTREQIRSTLARRITTIKRGKSWPPKMKTLKPKF